MVDPIISSTKIACFIASLASKSLAPWRFGVAGTGTGTSFRKEGPTNHQCFFSRSVENNSTYKRWKKPAGYPCTNCTRQFKEVIRSYNTLFITRGVPLASQFTKSKQQQACPKLTYLYLITLVKAKGTHRC